MNDKKRPLFKKDVEIKVPKKETKTRDWGEKEKEE